MPNADTTKQGNSNTAKILENYLRYWEDKSFIFEALRIWTQSNPELNLIKPYSFRKFLLNARTLQDPLHESKEEFSHPLDSEVGLSNQVPYGLTQWTLSSRRIFNIPIGLQALLEMTDVKGKDAENFKTPFDSFVISLDFPIISEGHKCSTLFFYTMFEMGFELMVVEAIPDELEHFQIFSNRQRKVIRKDFNPQKKSDLLLGFINKGIEKDNLNKAFGKYIFKNNLLSQIEEVQKEDPTIKHIISLFFSFCLMFKNLPNSQRKTTIAESKPLIKRKDPHLIVSDAQVCEVKSSHYLSTEQLVAIGYDIERKTRPSLPNYVVILDEGVGEDHPEKEMILWP